MSSGPACITCREVYPTLVSPFFLACDRPNTVKPSNTRRPLEANHGDEMMKLLLVIGALSTLLACGQPSPAPTPAPDPSQVLVPQEGFPPDRWAQMAEYTAALKATPGAGPLTPGAV